MNIRQNVPLAPLTTFGVGGSASHFADVDVSSVAAAVRQADYLGLPIFVLGAGSNILVDDAGVRGLVMRFTGIGISHTSDGLVSVRAGTRWDDVVTYSIANGLAGIECLSGVPGTAGAAPVQNIGCYGQQLSDVLERVYAFDLNNETLAILDAAECQFGYRSSIFNTTRSGRYLVTDIVLRLKPGGRATLTYADIAHLPPTASLAAVREAVIDVRRRKGMLWSPGGASHKSAGSFFRNPIVDESAIPAGAPRWRQPDGSVKVSAAWLIEHAGHRRGDRHGGAAISPDHALALINTGSATARDIFMLARAIRDGVRAKTGICLEPEVRMWGFNEPL